MWLIVLACQKDIGSYRSFYNIRKNYKIIGISCAFPDSKISVDSEKTPWKTSEIVCQDSRIAAGKKAVLLLGNEERKSN